MSKIVEITYSESKTIQEEDYSPRNFHISAKGELIDGENVEEAYTKLKETVKKQLKAETETYTKGHINIIKEDKPLLSDDGEEIPF